MAIAKGATLALFVPLSDAVTAPRWLSLSSPNSCDRLNAFNPLTDPPSGGAGALEERGSCVRVALIIQYIGTHFCGWQRQPRVRTVQEVIEAALESVVEKHIPVVGSGRTDSGVHAAAQVAHFDAPSHIPAHRWASILNSRLPSDVVIRASAAVDFDWHARFSATCRRYRYLIYTDSKPNLFVRPYSWHYYKVPLDIVLMERALKPLLGHHHLSAFRRSGSTRPHSWVDIQDVECVRDEVFIRIEIQASGFLYGMVRLLVGLLADVGRGTLSPEAFTQIWRSQKRDLVKYAAPPQGLCLLRVTYPDFPFPREDWYNSQPLFFFPNTELSGAQKISR